MDRLSHQPAAIFSQDYIKTFNGLHLRAQTWQKGELQTQLLLHCLYPTPFIFSLNLSRTGLRALPIGFLPDLSIFELARRDAPFEQQIKLSEWPSFKFRKSEVCPNESHQAGPTLFMVSVNKSVSFRG